MRLQLILALASGKRAARPIVPCKPAEGHSAEPPPPLLLAHRCRQGSGAAGARGHPSEPAGPALLGLARVMCGECARRVSGGRLCLLTFICAYDSRRLTSTASSKASAYGSMRAMLALTFMAAS